MHLGFRSLLCGGALASLCLLCAACTGPSLRALSPDEAKIDVYPSGEIRVCGEKTPLKDLARVVRRSNTRPEDPIFIRLHGNADSPELLRLRKQISRQMVQAEHYKFNFFSTPHATVTTTDPRTGRSQTFISEQALPILKGDDAVRDVERLQAERAAYAEGTYVSTAAGLTPVATNNKPPEELRVNPQVETPSPTPRPLAQPSAARAQPAVAPAPAPEAPNAEKDALRAKWMRQQRMKAQRTTSSRIVR